MSKLIRRAHYIDTLATGGGVDVEFRRRSILWIGERRVPVGPWRHRNADQLREAMRKYAAPNG